MTTLAATLSMLLAILAGPSPAIGQDPSHPEQADPEMAAPPEEPGLTDPLMVEPDLPEDGWLDRSSTLTLRLSRPLHAGERLAVFVDATDVTDLFHPSPEGDMIRYVPRVVRLPSGERELTVYRVPDGADWEEVGRFPLAVRGVLGMETTRATPSLDLSMEGQLAEGHEPDELASERPTYQDFTGQASLDLEATRASFRTTAQLAAIGVSHHPNALRFGEMEEEAPKVDLSDYLVQVDVGRAGLSQGHVSVGNQRHLISGFSSRGAVLSVRPSDRVDVALGAVNGSSLVGWSNFLGLDEDDHRILSGTMGLEVLDRPGALRVELSAMDGSVLPFSGFDQGVINDAEESRGLGAVIMASDASGRVRMEGGFARSTFVNPEDPSLSFGDDLVPVEEETRDARYLEASAGLLRNLRLSDTRTLSLTLGWRHERVDPLYRSLGAYARPDQLNNRFEAQAQVAGIDIRGSRALSEDNLDEIPSILKSKTRRTGLNVGVPLASLVAGGGSPWLPRLSWGFDRTHQFGTEVPESGGFDPSHVPDQVSTRHTASADWSLAAWLSLGYRLSHSHQDNRQPGRENADFTNRAHGVNAGIRPLSSLSFDLSLDLEEAESHEREEVEETRRAGVRASWSPFQRSSLSASLSRTVTEDDAETRRRANTQFDAQWSSFVPGLSVLGGQYYLRFARSVGRARDLVFDFDDRRENWTLSSGLSFSFSP